MRNDEAYPLHRFRIDAITLFAVPATGPHGFHAIGRYVVCWCAMQLLFTILKHLFCRTIESTLRTMNNLLERLHASFFFYILKEPTWFLKIGLYLPSAILVSVAMMFHGLSIWVDAGWIKDDAAKQDEKRVEVQPTTPQWKRRQRPVIGALSIMAATHVLGLVLFGVISSSLFMKDYKVFHQF